jgi:hypothetical protein
VQAQDKLKNLSTRYLELKGKGKACWSAWPAAGDLATAAQRVLKFNMGDFY